MGSTVVAAKSEENKSKARAPQDFDQEPPQLQHSTGASAGLPRFLRGGTAGGDGSGGIQRKLAASKPFLQFTCVKCQEEDDEARGGARPGSILFAQAKCACCGGSSCKHDHQDVPAGLHRIAHEGVASASQPLPHLDRIQASFGSHAIGGTRTAIGGPAARANESMGSLAYATGDRIAFGREPDVKLAAHEAAHVVQQRGGAKLPGGMGRHGDEYEQQADAVAEAVDRGDSAEPILDRHIPRGPNAPEPLVQNRLAINAPREIEPPVVSSPDLPSGGVSAGGGKAGGGAAGGNGAAQAGPGAGEKGEAEAKNEGPDGTRAGKQDSPQAPGGAGAAQNQVVQSGPQNAGAQQGQEAPASPPTGGTAQPGQAPQTGAPTGGNTATQAGSPAPIGTPATAGNGGGGTVTTGGNQAPCAGSGAARCYDAPSEKPAKDPAEPPPNPPGTEVKEETPAGDEQDLPEPDDCPAQKAKAGPSAAAPAAGGAAPAATAATAAGGTAPAETSTPAIAGSAAANAGPAAATATGGPKGPTAGSSPVGGGGGASAESGPEAAVRSVASPLEGAVALSEGQRAAAVASYAASSAALQSAAGGTQTLRGGIRFAPSSRDSSEDANRRQAAAARAESFFAASADQIDGAIAFASAQVPDRLGALAESAKARIAASVETQKDAISGSIEKARGEARHEAAVARLAVASQAASFVANVESGTAGAIAALTAAHATTIAQVGELETSTLAGVNQIYGDRRVQLEGIGSTVGGECTATGEKFAQTYEGFVHCTENGFWDGDLSERRAYAQAKAARKTAKGYHDQIVETAKKQAREITKVGRKQNRCAVIAAARHGREALDQQLANLITALQTARDAAIQQAGNTRGKLSTSIDSGLTATLRQLDQTEHDQRQAADDTGYMQQVMQEQLAHAGAAALQRAVVDASTALQTTLFDLQFKFASSNPPDLAVLDQALNAVAQRIDSAMSGLQSSIGGGTGAIEQQLASAAGAGLAALEAVTASSNAMVGTLSGGFSSSMDAIAGTDNFAAQRQGFSQQIQQATAGGIAALAQAVSGMREGCDAITADSHKSLDKASVDLEKTLRGKKQGLECEIPQRADEAASHEAPAWKMLVAILLVIVVIAIIIAVTVLTAGMALGPLAMIGAGILIGAAVGAVTSGLLAIAGNLWSNQRWGVGVGHAVLVGAITGAIGGGIGAGAGLALKGFSVAVQYGAAMVTAGLLDAGGQFVMGGFSFKSFSWTNLGITLVVTALTLGLAHSVGGPKPTGTAAAGEGARPTVEPVAEPTTAPHEPVPTPTEPGATPAEPVTAPTDTAAHPTEPVAQPTEPTAHPAEPTAQAAEPSAEPTKPGAPEAPAAEPGRPSTTPEENTVLDGTANKSSEELTPAEVTTEREVAGRSKGESIEDPPFTTRRELPNGHEVEETPEGELFKRCSDHCVIFNSKGEPVGETPAAGPKEEPPTATQSEEHPAPAPTEEAPTSTEPSEGVAPTDTPEESGSEPKPWEEGREPARYRRYVRNLNRRSLKAGGTPKEALGPEEWWERIGSKAPYNPYGGKGDPVHQQVIKDLLPEVQSKYPAPKYRITSEQPLPEGTGIPRREPDIAVIDNETGRVVKIYEAARFNKSGGLLRGSEKAKIPDYQGAYGGEGIPYEFHPAGPNKPPNGVLQSPTPTDE
jgi:hypothetical protein